VHGAPIPLYYDYEEFDFPVSPATKEEYPVVYYGPRFKDSLEMHRQFANRSGSYGFKFPPNMNLIEAITKGARTRPDQPRPFEGMNPELKSDL